MLQKEGGQPACSLLPCHFPFSTSPLKNREWLGVAGVALSLVPFSPHGRQNSTSSSKTTTTTERVASAQRCKVRVTVVPRAVIATPSSTGIQNGCANTTVCVLTCRSAATKQGSSHSHYPRSVRSTKSHALKAPTLAAMGAQLESISFEASALSERYDRACLSRRCFSHTLAQNSVEAFCVVPGASPFTLRSSTQHKRQIRRRGRKLRLRKRRYGREHGNGIVGCRLRTRTENT